jgi:hypothetical protein
VLLSLLVLVLIFVYFLKVVEVPATRGVRAWDV